MAAALLLALVFALPAAAQQVRIKDIADVEGVRDNQLVGYGLVVGLNGTGDRLRSAVFTRQSLIGVLERLGVNTRDQEQPAGYAQRGGRDGHRQPAALRQARQPHRHRGLDTRRCHQPHRRHAAGHAAARRGWGGLCGGAGRRSRRVRSAARGAGASVTRGVPTAGRIANPAPMVEREVAFQLRGAATRSASRCAIRTSPPRGGSQPRSTASMRVRGLATGERPAHRDGR
jgi:flagellar P-ring protein FlgI